jgi:Flp pilus assembly protein TadG
MRPLFHQILRDSQGATVVEFALVAPVLMLTLVGLFDLSYNIYAASMLEGAIQEAARESTIEGHTVAQSTIDAKVTDVIETIVPTATVAFARSSYTNFADVVRPEDFTDTNGDGQCNGNEPFEDVNGNNLWDSNRGQTGMGGARDAVLYTVTVTYPRRLPLHKFIGIPDTVTTVARTVLRNQPYGMQDSEVTVGNC